MLQNVDIIEYCRYEYKNLVVPYNLTYLLCVKIWCLLDLKIRNYESFSNRIL